MLPKIPVRCQRTIQNYFFKESLLCPELGLMNSLLLLFSHTSATPVTLIPIKLGTKYSPAINLRSKILSQYFIVNGKVTCILSTPENTKSSTYEVKISFFKHFFCGCFRPYVQVYMSNITKSPREELLNVREFSKNLKTLQSTLCNAWFWSLGLLWMSPGREIPFTHTLQYYPKNPHVSLQRPTAEPGIYFRALPAFLYAVWILNSKKNGEGRNASKVLFISPTSGKQLLKNKFYVV